MKTIDVPMYSCWYSIIKRGENEYIGFGRHQVTGDWTVRHPLNVISLNEQFELIGGAQQMPVLGEDPRTFYHNGDLYVVNNFVHNVQLINYDKQTVLPVRLPYKNFSWISHEGKLYAIYTMVPLRMFEVDTETGECFPFVSTPGEEYVLYRGGTPGYKISGKNKYYGFGHMTYSQAVQGHPSSYDPFLWIFDFETKKIDVHAIRKPSKSPLVQPTCVVDDTYLVTAESNDLWGGPTTPENWKSNGYATRLYKLDDELADAVDIIKRHSVMTPQ